MIQTSKDRLGDVYKGKTGTAAFQERTRKRIDWICKHTEGRDVLDIGCSQGIVGLLLARAGKNVLAVDIDPECISYAQRCVASEPLVVQQHVHYLCADFLEQNLEDAEFDTVLLTEILEHLEAPDACLEKITGLLRPDGQLLVMVPFGINPHPDHKRTYYFLDLLRCVQRWFQPVSVDFLEGWVAICAYSQQGERREGISFNEELVRRMETGFAFVDSKKQTSIDELKGRLKKLTGQVRDLDAQNESLSHKYETLSGNHEALTKAHEALTLQYDELASTYQSLSAEKRELAGICEALSAEKEGLIGTNEALTAQYKDLSDRYEKLSRQQTALTRKNKALKNKGLLFEQKYDVLSRSKFGRLQIMWWTRQGKRKRTKTVRQKKWKDRVHRLVQAHPFLIRLYMRFRPLFHDYETRPSNAAKAANPSAKTQNLQFKVPEWAYVPQEEFEKKTDRDFFQRIKPLLDMLPQSNGCRYYQRSQLKVGIVADRFFLDSIKDAADFLPIGPKQWMRQIENISFLLIVSAWNGLDGEWQMIANPNSQMQRKIFKIIAACKERGIPTIFYSKEDPPNYDRFLPISQHSDIVFTTCEEVVQKYKTDCETQKIYVLPFGIDPLLHNPIGMRNKNKQPGVIFSGSWMNKYPERCRDLRLLMDGVQKADVPLKIIDRNYQENAMRYRFPPEYWASISPSIDHGDLQKVHKLYDWALDINTVKTSMTMFANRGYELQASGSLQISNYSAGVNDKLPFVFIANEQQEVAEILKNMTPEDVYRRQIEGIRAMMTGETCFDRFGVLASAAGLSANQPARRIAVVADADTPRIRDMFERQSYPEKALLIASNITPEDLERYDMVAFFAEEMDYEIFYLEDMANGFKYTACDYITKDSFWVGEKLHTGIEHDYVERMESKYRTLFWREAFRPQALLEMTDGQVLPNGYSIDHFNFNARTPRKKTLPDGLCLSVIVPVYNNGRFLMAKCFASLQRSTMFHRMHIFLVDDGSTDGTTPNLVRYLERTYPNVTAYFFEDGGSGSASRPRNKGVELADTDYLTFLDPDNEAVNDAYAAMYDMLKEAPEDAPYDVVVGDLIRCSDRIFYGRYYKKLGCAARGSGVYNGDMRQLLMEGDLIAMSIQAMLIRRAMLVENHLEQVPGAAGQDTLFGWEVIAYARSVRITPLPVHIYYKMVSSSVTNSIGKRYFEKLSLIVGPRREFLQKFDLLQFYAEHRYNNYFAGWVLRRLCLAKLEDEEACAQIVYEMHKMYLDCYDGKNQIINEFAAHCDAGRYGQALAVIRQARQEGKL